MTAVVYFFSRHHRPGLDMKDIIEADSDLSFITCVQADDIETRNRIKSSGVTSLPVLYVTRDGTTKFYEKSECYSYILDITEKVKKLKAPAPQSVVNTYIPPQTHSSQTNKQAQPSEEKKEFKLKCIKRKERILRLLLRFINGQVL